MRWLKRMWKKLKRVLRHSNNSEPVQRELPLEQDGTPDVNETEKPTNERKVSMLGVALIASFEGFSSKPYLDSANVPTIGYGTIMYHNGKKVTMHDKPLTKKQSMDELWYEVNQKCKAVVVTTARYGLELEQHELDALCSFAYNVGVGPIVRRDSTVNRGIRNHDKALICKGMKLYCKAGGHRLRGLVKRRNIEVKVFKGECVNDYKNCGQL